MSSLKSSIERFINIKFFNTWHRITFKAFLILTYLFRWWLYSVVSIQAFHETAYFHLCWTGRWKVYVAWFPDSLVSWCPTDTPVRPSPLDHPDPFARLRVLHHHHHHHHHRHHHHHHGTTIITAIIITDTAIIITITITITITIIILTRPQPPYSWEEGLVGRIMEQGYSQAGTFLGILNVSLRIWNKILFNHENTLKTH